MGLLSFRRERLFGFLIQYRVTHQVVDIDLKVAFSMRSSYLNATFTSMSTGGFKQFDVSPCILYC